MAASNQTPILKLSQWSPSDTVRMEDFNADHKKIDNAFKNLQTDIWHAGTTPPDNKKLLWIDTTAVTGGLKFYNGAAWVHVPVAFTQGS